MLVMILLNENVDEINKKNVDRKRKMIISIVEVRAACTYIAEA